MTPNLLIKKDALLQNLQTLKSLTAMHGVSMSLATKGLVGHEGLVRLLVQNGADSICETHIQNLIKFKDIPVEKWLIRSPLISEADTTVNFADVSLVSEMSILKELSKAAARQERTHKIILMLELGELREGCMPDELPVLSEAAHRLPGLELYGIGANLSCFYEIVPDENNMRALVEAAEKIRKTLDIDLQIISGGASSSLKMLAEGRLPSAVNHLRIGEAVLLGNIVCYDVPYEWARTDAFTLNAEIMEVKEKPSLPWGERAQAAPPQATDNAPLDRGLRKRALIAIGTQDVRPEHLIPLDPKLEIIGATSDCLITDVTGCDTDYSVGDTVSFRLRYGGLLSLMASAYVEKILV